jgi:predicted cupin superfamily sugar epimerase
MEEARYWIDGLRLLPHPEGGFYRETYRSDEGIARAGLPGRFTGDRAFSTAIYFLLAGADFSALHRIKQDEVWHFYDGSTLVVHVIDPEGEYSAIKLGRRLEDGECPQAVVKAGCWFGASLAEADSYAFVGCTVAPGFDFADFEMPTREQFLNLFPRHEAIIRKLTREGPSGPAR